MILLRDLALYALPVLIAAGGWLYAFSLRGRAGQYRDRPRSRQAALVP